MTSGGIKFPNFSENQLIAVCHGVANARIEDGYRAEQNSVSRARLNSEGLATIWGARAPPPRPQRGTAAAWVGRGNLRSIVDYAARRGARFDVVSRRNIAHYGPRDRGETARRSTTIRNFRFPTDTRAKRPRPCQASFTSHENAELQMCIVSTGCFLL